MPNNNYWLEGSAAQLQPQQLVNFLQKALLELQQDYQILDQYLLEQQWADAAKAAHKLASLSKLLGTQAMSDYLVCIAEQKMPRLQQVDFRSGLHQAYQQDLHTLQARKALACSETVVTAI